MSCGHNRHALKSKWEGFAMVVNYAETNETLVTSAEQTPSGEVSGGTGGHVPMERETATTALSLPYNPVTGLFPLLEGPEYESFKEDIRTHGQHVPIWIYQ